MARPNAAADYHPPAARSRAVELNKLNTQRALAVACFLVPICFGLYSLWLGADSGFDLANYHLYNPFAWLHDKLRMDFAPAAMQSYFNPLLDVGLYLAYTHLPPPLVGFAMGALHGLSFVFILAIAQKVLPALSEDDRYRVPLLLALAGCLTGNFLSGLGNSMGDDTTALFSLASLLVLVSNWERLGPWSAHSVGVVVAGGVLVGLGAGLKLTNAPYAVALCVALLSYPDRTIVKLRIAFLFGIGVLLGFSVTGGYWMFHMWKTFGNPLYPQFGTLFPSPFAAPVGVSDTRWGPRSWSETILWPFIFTANWHRVVEIPIRQIIWPIVYVLLWLWLATGAAQWMANRKAAVVDKRARFVVLFVAAGFVIWMKVFSIYRYIVSVEVLAPLVVWIVMQRLLPYRAARRAAGGLIAIATVVVVTGGAPTWGHQGWTDPLYHAQVPAIAEPERTTVIIGTTSLRPWAWLATLFPPQVAFTQLESSFPATPAFYERIRQTAKERGGPVYAIIDGEQNGRIDTIAKANGFVDRMGLTDSTRGCDALRWTVARLHLHATVTPHATAGRQCALDLRADDVKDIAAENRADAAAAVPMFDRHGFTLHSAECTPYRAGIGDGVQVYQWCRVSIRETK